MVYLLNVGHFDYVILALSFTIHYYDLFLCHLSLRLSVPEQTSFVFEGTVSTLLWDENPIVFVRTTEKDITEMDLRMKSPEGE